MMNLYQLLKAPLYPFEILYDLGSSVTDSRICRKPSDVVFWNGFETELLQFRESNQNQLVIRKDFQSFPIPIGGKYRFVDENGVHGVLDNTILAQLTAIFPTIKITGTGVDGIRSIRGQPDRIAHRFSETKQEERLVLPIEIKKPLKNDDDLRNEYMNSAEHSRSKKIIQQAVGYLFENRKFYGVITSYEHTYGLYLDNDGILHMTRGIMYDSTNVTPLSVIWYLIHLAIKNKTKFTCPQLEEVGPDPEHEPKKRRTVKENSSPSSDEIPGTITTPTVEESVQIKSGGRVNRSKSVSFGKLNRKNVVVKRALSNTPEARRIEHEASIYRHLSKLQGITIPRVVVSGRDSRWFYLITEKRGDVISDITPGLVDKVSQAIDSLHNYRVCHGDLEPRNILLWRNRVYLIDFEDAIIGVKKSECTREKNGVLKGLSKRLI